MYVQCCTLRAQQRIIVFSWDNNCSRMVDFEVNKYLKKWSSFYFPSPIYVQIPLTRYSIFLSLQYSCCNFKRLLFCEMMPLFACIFDWGEIEVPSIILIVIGRLDLHNIKKFSTDMLCNVTPTYGAKQYARASITSKCDACAW